MAKESSREWPPDPNYLAARDDNRLDAIDLLQQAKVKLDNTMRACTSRQARTLVSTIYNVVREAEDLTGLLGELIEEYE